jgi:hypothetical protein
MTDERRSEYERGSAAAAVVCDLCGSARSPRERNRVVWATDGGDELVLADLCSHCAGDADRVLDHYGERGREALTVIKETRIEPIGSARAPRLARVLVYLLVGLASFFIVTLISSLR